MRRYLFAVLTSLALVAALPLVAAARSHDRGDNHRRADDRGERHHRRHNRIEHFRAHRAVVGKPMSQDIGTVQSFQGRTLKIILNDGSVVSGTVSRSTEVECAAMDQRFGRDDGGPGPSGGSGGDQRGGGNGDRGDDNDANDRGDDRGDDNDRAGENDNDNQDNANCLTALQTPGTHVRDATLHLTGAGAFWQRVDLDS
jgi:hypothetical protein